ncbi:MAG: hypothetical protein EU540_06725 [Promethearchaeota archaeon]|nr:MAG: hypothetical protein EU540_06725 [Candidatus Lokiarchaeota archaeon]
MIITIILISISTTISIIGIIYGLTHRENYGSKISVYLNNLLFLFFGIFFFTFFTLSSNKYFSKEIALILWNISLIIWVISVALLNAAHAFAIEHKKIINLSTFLYSFLGGINVVLLLSPDSIKIIQEENNYSFIFQNFHTLFFTLILNITTIIFMTHRYIRNLSNFRDKKSSLSLMLLSIPFSYLIIIYSIFLITQNIFIKNLYLLSYLICLFLSFYMIAKRPSLFFELTNRIYNFIVFHKSGLLLYSYNFETGKEGVDSFLKGPILIGISHILSNFADKKEQLNLLKMEELDIVFEYDNKFSYAILLITNHKNSIIENGVQRFMAKFSELNKENLIEISNSSKLIDISKFKNAKEIIIEYFNPYLIKQIE